MKGPGMLMLLGKAKESGSDKESGSGDYLDEAFDALKDDDRDGFKAAMKSFFRHCKSKSSDGDDEDEDEDDDEY